MLDITLCALSANRFNVAGYRPARLLNETETVLPGTDVTMMFKIMQIQTARDQEF
jgi:hypothetical protein